MNTLTCIKRNKPTIRKTKKERINISPHLILIHFSVNLKKCEKGSKGDQCVSVWVYFYKFAIGNLLVTSGTNTLPYFRFSSSLVSLLTAPPVPHYYKYLWNDHRNLTNFPIDAHHLPACQWTNGFYLEEMQEKWTKFESIINHVLLFAQTASFSKLLSDF